MPLYKHKCVGCKNFIMESPVQSLDDDDKENFYVKAYCNECINKIPTRKSVVKLVTMAELIKYSLELLEKEKLIIKRYDKKKKEDVYDIADEGFDKLLKRYEEKNGKLV